MIPHQNALQRTSEKRNGQAQALAFSPVDFAFVFLLAGLVALFFWRILTPNPLDRAQFPPGDFTDQFYAFRLYEARAFSEGRIPLWSENFNSGHPFLADIQSAVFYPIALANTLLNLVLFKSFSLFALELEALLHFWLAGAFTYLFARRVLQREEGTLRRTFRTARVGAFVSALVFMFGGYLTSYPSLQLAILETAVWLPLALFFIDRAVPHSVTLTPNPSPFGRGERNSLLPLGEGLGMRDLIAAGMVLGVAALAGHPQTFLFVFGVSVIYFLWRNGQATRDIRYPMCNLSLRAFFAKQSRRGGDCFVAKNAPRNDNPGRYTIRALGVIALLALIAFGIAAVQLVPAIEYQQLSTREALSFADAAKGFPTLDLLQFILPGYASAFASPLYVGILPLWLALFALLRKRKETIFWGLLALGALILSFGFYVFAYVIFYLFVPGASLFRQQERLAFVVSFALAMLAGYGITDLLSIFDAKRARKLFALLPAGAVMMLALLLVFFVAGALNPEGRLAFLGDRAGLMLIQFGLASLLVGLYLYFARERERFGEGERYGKRERYGERSIRIFAVCAIVLILFDLWSVSEPANKGRVEDRFADIPFAEQLQSDSGMFRVAADKQLLPGHFGIATGLEEVDGISPLRLARYDKLLQLPNAYEWLNVKYVITKQPQKVNGEIVSQEGDIALVRVQSATPRVWMTNDAVLEQDDSRAMQLLSRNKFSRIPRSIIAFPMWQAERMTLDVNTPAGGLLVLSENFYPGWRATVDEQPTEILRANLTLRAIPVRAGQHRIETWYDPLSFKLGAAISALTLLACIGALIYLLSTNTVMRSMTTNHANQKTRA